MAALRARGILLFKLLSVLLFPCCAFNRDITHQSHMLFPEDCLMEVAFEVVVNR